MNNLPRRKTIRLKNYDYSQNGLYFITICTYNRANLLSTIVGAGSARPNELKLTQYGGIIKEILLELQLKYVNLIIDKYIIMPNHIHLILNINIPLQIDENHPTVGQIIGYYKYKTTKAIDIRIWQRGYYEHIIRNEQDYQNICEYIDTNPLKWENDKYYEG